VSELQSEKRSPEAALSIPPPSSYKNRLLVYLVEKQYLSLNTVSFEFEQIPTSRFAEVRREVAESDIRNPLHADLKAVATWYLHQRGYHDIVYEQQYPESARIADVASVSSGFYAEVGYVADVSRIYQMLGLDVFNSGNEISSVLRRHPPSDEPTDRGGVQAMLSIPFPAEEEYSRAWELDELAIHTYTLGSRSVSTPNRRHRWWGEEE
jgi:hypothetical protein